MAYTWPIHKLGTTFSTQYCGEHQSPRGSVLDLRPPGFEFRILCLEGSVISVISLSSGGSSCPIYISLYVDKSGPKPDSFHSRLSYSDKKHYCEFNLLNAMLSYCNLHPQQDPQLQPHTKLQIKRQIKRIKTDCNRHWQSKGYVVTCKASSYCLLDFQSSGVELTHMVVHVYLPLIYTQG